MVNIEINGIPVQARDGAMVIEAADEAGITIPRFCYHKKLSIAASCRMCLVEVEKVAKPLPACATPVTDGMKVFTRSPKAIAAQKAVMEFLLINHPLDCPICDQGGECDLQEMAVGFGNDVSRFAEGKRALPSPNLGPLIATDMMRCIHCTRCVRFGQEIAGIMELGAPGRGEHMHIQTFLASSVDSELSGNVIDLCPVGALTSKPYRYTARPWELVSRSSVSPHDCVGANLRLDLRGNKVMRALPEENEAVNETWIADRDRFAYLALNAGDRVTRPQVKENGQWRETDWDSALTLVAEKTKTAGSDRLGALAGYTATVEELYLLQKLLRSLGSGNVDHRLRQQDFRDQAALPPFPWLGQSLEELEERDAVLLIGANVRKEQPLIAHRLRKAALRGAAVMQINPVDFPLNFPTAEKMIIAPSATVRALTAVAKALVADGGTAPDGFASLAADVAVDATAAAIAAQLKKSEGATVLLGSTAMHHPQAADLRALAALIAELSGSAVGSLAEGGNAAGAWLVGAVPHRGAGGAATDSAGKDWSAMLSSGLDACLLLGSEPELDCLDPQGAVEALKGIGCVVALTAHAGEEMRGYADVILPIALYPETSGTFVSAEGRWQSFAGCAAPPGEARPAWKILRVLGNLVGSEGFEYLSSEEVKSEVAAACAAVAPAGGVAWRCPESLGGEVGGIERIGGFALYGSDAMVRRSSALQETADGHAALRAVMSAATAEKAGVAGVQRISLEQGGQKSVLPLSIDESVADGCVFVAAGLAGLPGIGLGVGGVSVAAAEE